MSAALTTHPQFIFLTGPGGVSGFRIESDGSLSATPQRAVAPPEPPAGIFGLKASLAIVGQNSVSFYSVDPETGMTTFRRTFMLDSVIHAEVDPSGRTVLLTSRGDELMLEERNGEMMAIPLGISKNKVSDAQRAAARPLMPAAVLSRDQKFLYVLDRSAAQIHAFRIEGKQPVPLTPASYPVTAGSAALALVAP
jgi:hypothetical protein